MGPQFSADQRSPGPLAAGAHAPNWPAGAGFDENPKWGGQT